MMMLLFAALALASPHPSVHIVPHVVEVPRVIAHVPPRTEMRCKEYETVTVRTECHSDTIEKGTGGAIMGGVIGYLLGGKGWGLTGAAVGAGAGAADGKTTCVPITEQRCKVWIEVPVQ